MNLSHHFAVKELVHPDILDKLGDKRAAATISIYLVKQLEIIRSRFGATFINGNFNGKTYFDSGLRKASFYKTRWGRIRESFSTHQYGNTADCKFIDFTPIEIYNHIILNPEEYPYILRMENAHKTIGWLHIECGLRDPNDEIEVFDP